MTIGDLWDALKHYGDDTEIYIGYIEGHSIMQEDFEVIETSNFNGSITVSLMVEDINIINN